MSYISGQQGQPSSRLRTVLTLLDYIDEEQSQTAAAILLQP